MVILRVLAQQAAWSSFTDIQRAAGNLPPPTLSRLLKVLTEEGLVERDSEHGRYRKGPALLDLAHIVLGSMPKARLVQPMLDALADETGQSAAYFELGRDAIVMVAKAERPNSCHYIDVGERNTDLSRHGFARAILAHIEGTRATPLIENAPIPATMTLPELLSLLADIRAQGYCIERSESKPNWMRVTAPVHGMNQSGTPDAIGVTAIDLPGNSDTTALRNAVTAAANRVSEEMHNYYAARIAPREARE